MSVTGKSNREYKHFLSEAQKLQNKLRKPETEQKPEIESQLNLLVTEWTRHMAKLNRDVEFSTMIKLHKILKHYKMEELEERDFQHTQAFHRSAWLRYINDKALKHELDKSKPKVKSPSIRERISEFSQDRRASRLKYSTFKNEPKI